MPTYLADTSIWGWATNERRPDIAERLAERITRDEVVTCAPVVLETLHRARTGEEYDTFLAELFLPLEWLPAGEEAFAHALQTQRAMALDREGSHRRPAMDFLIAAVAEQWAADVVLWAFDRDLRVICEHTGQPHEIETA